MELIVDAANTRLAALDHDRAKTELKAWFECTADRLITGGDQKRWSVILPGAAALRLKGPTTDAPGRPSGARPVLFTPAAVSFSYVCRKQNLNDKQGSRSGPGGGFRVGASGTNLKYGGVRRCFDS